jgi:hypothetical protein
MERDVMTASNIRYFYSPRAALHQMLAHGFNFPGYAEDAICNLIGSGDENTLLETDSMPLLKPRPGDILIRAGIEEHVTMHNLFLFVHRAPDTEHLFEGFLEKGGMIIQRNGLPFHWPQAEQAP